MLMRERASADERERVSADERESLMVMREREPNADERESQCR